MRSTELISILAFTAQAFGHGYVYRVTADNTVYPGWDVAIDPWMNPPPARIAYGGGIVGPIMDIKSPNMACNMGRSPAPAAVAEVRAGSDVTFHWSHWLHSHKGPITAWMAPYDGDVHNISVNELEFFKFAEDTVDEAGVWANVRMMDKKNGTWTATIPADIRPGNYIVRHEIVALHFSLGTSPGFEMLPIGPQFYMGCFNFKVTGNGDAAPKGVKFPGAYRADEPGMRFDVRNQSSDGKSYTPLGPTVYNSRFSVNLPPKELTVVSPTGKGAEADAAYFQTQSTFLERQGAITSYFDSIGG